MAYSVAVPEVIIPEEVIDVLPSHKLSKEELEDMTAEEWHEFAEVLGQNKTIPYGCILRLKRAFRARYEYLKSIEEEKALREESAESLLHSMVNGTVSKLFDNGTCVGTFIFISNDLGICAHHCVYSETTGTKESTLRVEGRTLKLMVFFPRYDVAVYRVPGRNGAFLKLGSSSAIYEGNRIVLVSFPSLDSQGQDDEEEGSVLTYGRISRKTVSWNSLMMLGQYPSFPNSSGGAIVSKNGRLLGLHIESAYHEDHTHYRPVRTHQIIADEAIFDIHWTKLRFDQDNVNSRSPKTVGAFAASNVKHKQSLGVFVPVSVLHAKFQEHDVLGLRSPKRIRHQ